MQSANEIKFRCSSLGYLMVEPKGKSNAEKLEDAKASLVSTQEKYATLKTKDGKIGIGYQKKITELVIEIQKLEPIKDKKEISESTKTHLVDKFISAKYNRDSQLVNKYIAKGLAVEEDGLTLYSRVKKEFYTKNEHQLSNAFISGTPDLFLGESIDTAEVIIDIKCSWDIYTFFRTKFAPLNKMYYWQMQGYMALTGATKAKLAYCLVNTPEPLIFSEINKIKWQMGVINPDTDESYKTASEIREAELRYDDISISERFFEVEIERNDADIQSLYQRIQDCRTYMNETFYNK